MLQAGRSNPKNFRRVQSFKRFDEFSHDQAFKYFVYLAFRHARGKPYLSGVCCVLSRDHRQHTFLVARQKGGFVGRAHHDPKRFIWVAESYASLCVQLDHELPNSLVRDSQFFHNFATRHWSIQQFEEALPSGAQ